MTEEWQKTYDDKSQHRLKDNGINRGKTDCYLL